jgi:hypothetical protein
MATNGKAELEKRGALSAQTWVADLIGDIATCRQILADNSAPMVKLAALDRVYRNMEMAGRYLNVLQPPAIQALFVSIGVSSEDELRRIMDERKRLSSISFEDMVTDWLDSGRMILSDPRANREEIRSALFGEREVNAEGDSSGPYFERSGKTGVD